MRGNSGHHRRILLLLFLGHLLLQHLLHLAALRAETLPGEGLAASAQTVAISLECIKLQNHNSTLASQLCRTHVLVHLGLGMEGCKRGREACRRATNQTVLGIIPTMSLNN